MELLYINFTTSYDKDLKYITSAACSAIISRIYVRETRFVILLNTDGKIVGYPSRWQNLSRSIRPLLDERNDL